MKRPSILGIAALSCACAVGSGRPSTILIRGHVVAFRPADRIAQTNSDMVSREVFLLQTNGKSRETVKIIYEHGGYSEIWDRPVGKSPILILKVRRDRSCDGNYGQFVSDAPIVTIGDKTDSIPAVKTVGEFNGLQPSYKLKCYRLRQGDIQ